MYNTHAESEQRLYLCFSNKGEKGDFLKVLASLRPQNPHLRDQSPPDLLAKCVSEEQCFLFFYSAALFTHILYYALLGARSCRFKVKVSPCLPVELISLSVHTCILAVFCRDIPNTTHIQCMSQPVTAYCRHIPLSEYLICTEYTYLSPCVGLGANTSEISAHYSTPVSVE